MKISNKIEFDPKQGILFPETLADGEFVGIFQKGVLGATIAFGDLVYFNSANSRWSLANANSTSTSGDVKLGICLIAGNSADPTNILIYGKIRANSKFPTLTISAPVYVSTTNGLITQSLTATTDYVARKIGFAESADELFFNPSCDFFTYN